MRGLILKDFINLKKNAKIFAAITVMYVIMALFYSDASFFGSIFTMLFAILTLSLYSYDDMAKWDSFALTMPIRKNDIVQGKYIMMLLLTLIGLLYSSIFTLVINIVLKRDDLVEGFVSIGAGAAIVILFYSIIIPFVTKLGVEKARLILFVVYFIPFFVGVGAIRLMKDRGFTISDSLMQVLEFLMKYVYLIVPPILLIILATSYFITVKIYRKKEF